MGHNGKTAPFSLIRNTPPEIPIVGQPAHFDTADVRVLVAGKCTCQPEAPPILIGGVDQRGECKACGALYAIGEVAYQRAPDMVLRINVGRITPIAPAQP